MFTSLLGLAISNLILFALQITGNGSFPPALGAEEEKRCLIAYKEGDIAARDKLIKHNLRLVAHVVKKYYSSSLEQDDLISIGTIGLIKAVSTFDYTKGTRLATYASRCIDNEILMHFRFLKKSAQDVYISDPIDSDADGNTLSLIDIIYDDDSIEDNLEKKQLAKKLYAAVNKLEDERERAVISLRYGLYNNSTHTQREVGAILDISRSYVSRIEKKALQFLRKELADEKL